MNNSFLEGSLGFNIYRAELLFRRESLNALSRYDMTPEQWSVLSTLLQSDKPLSQQDIANRVLKDKHTTSRIIKRLERDGWIIKKTDKKDKRSFLLQPTKASKKLKMVIPAILTKHFSPFYSHFTDTEYQHLLTYLKKIRTIFGDP